MMGMRRPRLVLALGLVLAAAAAGCGRGGGDSVLATAPCPRIAILADAADLTRFRPGGGTDLSAMVVDARIAGFQARCDFARRGGGGLEVTVTPQFAAERGPAAGTRAFDLPWFIALTDAEDREILAKREFTARLAFAANVGQARTEAEPVALTVPIGEGRRADDYVVRLGFQLSPEELAFNRRRGPR